MITKKSLLEVFDKLFGYMDEKEHLTVSVANISDIFSNLPDDEPETSGYIQERPVDGGGGTNPVKVLNPTSIKTETFIPGGGGGDPNFDYSNIKYSKIQLGISKEEELQSYIVKLKHKIKLLEEVIRDMAEVIGK